MHQQSHKIKVLSISISCDTISLWRKSMPVVPNYRMYILNQERKRKYTCKWITFALKDMTLTCARCQTKEVLKSALNYDDFYAKHKLCRIKRRCKWISQTKYTNPFTGQLEKKNQYSIYMTPTAEMYFREVLGFPDSLEGKARDYYGLFSTPPEYMSRYVFKEEL